MTSKVSNVGKPDRGSVVGRTMALAEAVDAVFGPGTSKNVTRHAGSQGADKLVGFLRDNAPALREGLDRPPAAPADAQARGTATAPATNGPTRKQLESTILLIEPRANTNQWPAWSDSEMRLECERVCFQAHQRFPGMRGDAELGAEFWRHETLTGTARFIRAGQADAIAKLFKR